MENKEIMEIGKIYTADELQKMYGFWDAEGGIPFTNPKNTFFWKNEKNNIERLFPATNENGHAGYFIEKNQTEWRVTANDIYIDWDKEEN